MKKTLALILTLALSLTALTACGSKTETPADTSGDNGAQTEAPAETTLSGSVSTNGSTSMEKVIGALSEQFMADNSGVTVTYDPTGSGAGIEAATNGSADIGLSSRALKDEETANGLTGTIRQGDLNHCRQWAPRPGGYDLVISNPPYFAPNTGKTAEGARKTARSETACTVEGLCAAAGWLLHPGGRFALCYRAERLATLFSALEGSGIAPKRLQLVQHSPALPPKIVLVEGVRMGRPGLKVLPTLFVNQFNAQWRKEIPHETAL